MDNYNSHPEQQNNGRNSETYRLSKADIEFLNREAVTIYDDVETFEISRVPPVDKQAVQDRKRPQETPDSSWQSPEFFNVTENRYNLPGPIRNSVPAMDEAYIPIAQQDIYREAETIEFNEYTEGYPLGDCQDNISAEPFRGDPPNLYPVDPSVHDGVLYTGDETGFSSAVVRKTKIKQEPFFSDEIQHNSREKESQHHDISIYTIINKIVCDDPFLTEEDILYLIKKEHLTTASMSRRSLRKALMRAGLDTGYKRFRAYISG